MIYEEVDRVKIVNYTFVKQPQNVKDAPLPQICKRTFKTEHKSIWISTFLMKDRGK